jgi:Transcriptional regulator, effector-binding domain/component
MPQRKVISLRKKVSNYMDESLLWDELFKEIKKQNIKLLDLTCPIAVYHDQEYKEKNVDIEVQMGVEQFYKDTEVIKFYTTKKMEIISITFTGNYDKMTDVTKSAMLWLEINNYELIQPTFCIFHISPAQDNDPNKWITEACFIIKERKI